MTLGTAACITGTSQELIRRVPDLRGMKNEVIIQKSHRYSYDHGVRSAGVHFIEVETVQELEAAITEQTAMLFFFFLNDANGTIKLEEFAGFLSFPPIGTVSKKTSGRPFPFRSSGFRKIRKTRKPI